MRVEASGRASVRRPPREEIEIQLEGPRLAHLRSLLTGSHFRSLASSYFLPRPAVAGGYAWRISHDGSTVSTRDGEAPRGLAALMRELAALIDESAFADDGELAGDI